MGRKGIWFKSTGAMYNDDLGEGWNSWEGGLHGIICVGRIERGNKLLFAQRVFSLCCAGR